MYPQLLNYSCWSNGTSAFSSANSVDDAGSKLQTLSDSSVRSCSPDLPSTTDSDHFPFDSVFNKQYQSLRMQQTSVPYQRQHVSYPGAMGAAWQTMPRHNSFFDNQPCPPKRYIFEASECCSAPRIRVIHDCCNKESTPREMVEDRPLPRRNFSLPSKLTLCRFCLKNGEPPSVYYSHNLHVEDGRVSCPVLRRYDCPICHNGGGDFAHTVRYCPRVRVGLAR